ncbi:hypothetical protein BDR06DRAFT_190805 [Suillus hirtellus]|nr:hypothetical protein BDR06DRAFT_190805 [Suillus hirtellus]
MIHCAGRMSYHTSFQEGCPHVEPIGYSYQCTVPHRRTYLHKYVFCETKVDPCIRARSVATKDPDILDEYAVFQSSQTMNTICGLPPCSADGHRVIRIFSYC